MNCSCTRADGWYCPYCGALSGAVLDYRIEIATSHWVYRNQEMCHD